MPSQEMALCLILISSTFQQISSKIGQSLIFYLILIILRI